MVLNFWVCFLNRLDIDKFKNLVGIEIWSYYYDLSRYTNFKWYFLILIVWYQIIVFTILVFVYHLSCLI